MNKKTYDVSAVKKVKFKMIIWFTSIFTITIIILSTLIIRQTNNVLKEKISHLTSELNNQSCTNLNTLLTQVETAADYMESLTKDHNKAVKEGSYTKEEYEEAKIKWTNFFGNFSAIRTYDDLAIIYDDGSHVGILNSLEKENLDTIDLYNLLAKELINNRYRKTWLSGSNDNFKKIFYTKKIYDNAIFMCSLDSKKIEEFVSRPGFVSMETLLINAENKIIYSSTPEMLGIIIPTQTVKNMESREKWHSFQGKLYNLSICSNGWKLINSTEVKELLKERKAIITFVIILGVIAVSIILIFCIVFSLQLTIPIENLIQTLHNQATRDKLTRFFNETTFTENCSLKLKDQNTGKQALFYIDIDHFNYLVEFLGRDESNKIIADVADSLRHVFPKTALFCRLGSDRFLVLNEIENNKDINDVISDYCSHFQQELFARFQGDFDVTASIGISIYPDQEKRYPLLLNFAEKAMNYVKKEGRNNWHIFDPENDLKK